MISHNSLRRAWLKAFIVVLISVSAPFIFDPSAGAQEPDTLVRAQWLYQHEDYEEALEIFKGLRSSQPASSEIAYYVGMTYKKLQDFDSARPHLEAAATLEPPVKNAALELIDLLYQTGDFDAARTWIERAERERSAPAQTAFFKGLVLLRDDGNPEEAIRSLEEAERLDPTLKEPVRYQKGLAYVKLKNYGQAKDLFKEIVLQDPSADLAAYANEYVTALTRQQDAERPLHGLVGYSLQYDDNVIFKPTDNALAGDVTHEDDFRHVFNGQAEYTLKPSDKFALRTGYTFYGSKQNSIGFYDTMSHDVSAQPTFYGEKTAVAFPVHYNYVGVNEEKYIEVAGIGNINNVMIGRDQMVQTQLQVNSKEYYFDVTLDDEHKDGAEYSAALAWFRFFGKGKEGVFSLRYTLSYEDTSGRNWEHLGNRATATAVVPLAKKLKWNIVGDVLRQDFAHRNSVYDKDRHDNVLTVSNLLAYEFAPNTELQVQYTYAYDGASIGIYKYRKIVVGAGVRYRF